MNKLTIYQVLRWIDIALAAQLVFMIGRYGFRVMNGAISISYLAFYFALALLPYLAYQFFGIKSPNGIKQCAILTALAILISYAFNLFANIFPTWEDIFWLGLVISHVGYLIAKKQRPSAVTAFSILQQSFPPLQKSL